MKVFIAEQGNPLSLNPIEIKQCISDHGGALIRNYIDPNRTRSVIPKLYRFLDPQEIAGTTSGTRDTVRKNSTKWSVGGHSGAQIGNARLMVSIYNPLSDSDLFNFHDVFLKLIELRDAIRSDNKSTKDEHLKNNAFNACRFQIYPKGGGFMLGHTDYVAEETSKLQSAGLFQLVLSITQRGIDFTAGGAYVKHNNELIDLEGEAKSGDIAIYDGSSFHGVADIDPFLPLSTNSIRGRIAALVTIYK